LTLAEPADENKPTICKTGVVTQTRLIDHRIGEFTKSAILAVDLVIAEKVGAPQL
jgi:hypothetical protein